MNMKYTLFFSVVCGAALLVGCSQEAKDKYDEAGSQAGKAAKTAGDAVAADANAAKPKVQAAADEASKKLDETKKAAEQALMTGKVKQALLAANGLDASGINVTTADYKITMTGTVPNKDQKAQALQLAQGIGGNGFTVVDELKIK